MSMCHVPANMPRGVHIRRRGRSVPHARLHCTLIYLADQVPEAIRTVWEDLSFQILDEDVRTPFLCPQVPADFR